MFGAWGVLPVAVLLLAFVSWRLTRWLFCRADAVERLAGGVVVTLTVVHLEVGWLGQLGLLSRTALLELLVVAAAALAVATRRFGFRLPRVPPGPALRPVALGVLGVLLAAIVTARILPLWQWDALGYHLPFVHFVLQSGGFADVPADVRYISTYPHDVELWMVWLRAMLPDDRLVDLAQVPAGAFGVALTAAIARRLGAPAWLSLLAGFAWLCAPGVFLQLPTDYVDVGTATALLGAVFFLLFSKVTLRTWVAGGVALGLFLGSKPSAPLATALLGAVAVGRALHAQKPMAAVLLALAVLVFGGEMYLVMLLHHGNPVWPVAVHLGPWVLPGESSVDTLLAAGAATPRPDGSLLARMTTAWLAVDASPVFDMRLGGFGALFLVALPAAIVALVRRRGGWLLVALAASLLSPDAAVTRYVLAFAALVFAAAASELTRLPRAPRLALAGLVLLGGALQVAQAWPGLVGDGPPWATFWSATDEERRVALGPNGRPDDYPPSWERVGEGEAAAFDVDFEFPGLLWSPELRYPVHFVPAQTGPSLAAWAQERQVRLLAVGPVHQAQVALEPERWEKLFDCRSTPCAVYRRR